MPDLTRDPVRWATVLNTLVGAVVVVLLAADVVSTRVGAIIVGLSTALHVAVAALFVQPTTVAIKPLEELAAAVAVRATEEPAHPPAPL